MLESSISNRFSLQGREEVGTVVAYHAGLSDVRKRLIGRLWARGHVPIISIYHRHHRDRSETSRPALRFCILIEFGLSFDSELPYNYGNRESRQARVSSELDGPVQVRVLVATTAVGMGLDAAGTVTQSAESPSKTQVLTITTLVFSFLSAIVPSDVSTVIHHTLPPSLSTYWQQAGR